jgi:hypothetical protein
MKKQNVNERSRVESKYQDIVTPMYALG